MATIFESYELTATLAETVDGTLHEARDRSTNALSLLQRPSGKFSIEAGRQKLLRESGVLGQLAAVPGVPKVVRLCQGESGDALVLRYFRGMTMTEYLKAARPDVGQAIVWTIRLAELLDGVHRAGFLHRNLSPQTILVAPWAEDFLLTDFSLASPVQESPPGGSPDPVHDWSYLAPEQTGRIHLPVDRRTDFYALGVLLYVLLEGAPPFGALGALEAIHAHLAKVPPAPSGPQPLADVVLKLLSKDPGERYQSTTGLIADLNRCLAQWKNNEVEVFALGTEDQADQLRSSTKLFGREHELNVLREAYDAAAAGTREILLIGGASGVGKTALVTEAGSWALADQSFFLTGKFDSQREQPYAAVGQQLEDLVRQILRGSQREHWQQVFSEALRDNLSVVTSMVPAFETLVGPQSAPSPLPPRETENRLFFTMESLLRSLRTADSSVILFFDDVQWIDPASGRLLEYLREQRDRSQLMVIYSYRENEAHPSSLFPLFLENVKAAATRPVLTLLPLNALAVKRWLTELLGPEIRAPEMLVQSLLAKTAGSPFFLSQLVRRLHREGVIWYGPDRRWDWNQAALAVLPASENVSDLLIAQIRALPAAAGTLLGIAACLGSSLTAADLALFSDEIPDLAAALWPLIDLQYLVPQSDGYLLLGTAEYRAGTAGAPQFSLRFQHDRIRQSAYEQLDAEVRGEIHLKLARLLEESRPVEAAGHYLTVIDRIGAEDLDHLARFLITVGLRARAASATQQALGFFRKARDLAGRLPAAETKRLLLLLAETTYLCHEIPEADRLSLELFQQMGKPEDKAEVLMMQMDACTFLGRLDEALDHGTKAMTLLGRSLPLKPGPAAMAGALLKVMAKTSRRTTEALFQRRGDVPEPVRLKLRLLGKFLVPAQMSGNINLFALSTLMTADLALDHGNSAESSGAFGNFAILLSVMGRHRQAFDYATLALRLEEASPNPRTAAGVHSAYSFYTLPWNRPWSEVPPAARRGADAALRSGDLFFTAYQSLFSVVFSPPPSLEEAITALRETLKLINAARQDDAWVGGMFALQRWRSLAGEREHPADFSEPGFDEPESVRAWVEKNNATGLAVYHLYKMQVLFHLGRFEEAWDQWQQCLPLAQSLQGSAYSEELSVYSTLICAEQVGNKNRRRAALAQMKKGSTRLASWAATTPENFAALAALAKAEEAEARRWPSAVDTFSRAVSLAEGLRVRWKALICERAAGFHLRSGDKALGTYLLKDAYRCYSLWGAREKLRQLERVYPELGLSGSIATPAHQPWDGDAATLWKISQVISREMDFDRLLSLVLQAVIENAGARRGWLLLEGESGWEVVASGNSEGAQVFTARVSPESEGISGRILSEVKDQGLLVASAQNDPRFSDDPLVTARKLKSVLALRFSPPGSPLKALWYLENDLVEGAFSKDRLDGLRLLSGQIGISLENARIYRALTELNRDLEGKVQQRTSELEESNRQFRQSVEYAGVLQRSLLPREWGTSVADSFVFWNPKDIVGGDLYWFREARDSCLLAVFDCTGHGIPGSLITMLVHSILDDAMTSSPPGDLSAVLSKANQQFRRALGQDRPGSESNDGFDIGLLWWSPKGGDLRYAGARISLLHSAGGPLSWVHGERRGLGYPETPDELATAVHTVPRSPGARYYLSSDGFLSQVGGPKGISLGRDRFAALLESSAELPLNAQGTALRQSFEEYRGARAQVDDITVFGVQLR